MTAFKAFAQPLKKIYPKLVFPPEEKKKQKYIKSSGKNYSTLSASTKIHLIQKRIIPLMCDAATPPPKPSFYKRNASAGVLFLYSFYSLQHFRETHAFGYILYYLPLNTFHIHLQAILTSFKPLIPQKYPH